MDSNPPARPPDASTLRPNRSPNCRPMTECPAPPHACVPCACVQASLAALAAPSPRHHHQPPLPLRPGLELEHQHRCAKGCPAARWLDGWLAGLASFLDTCLPARIMSTPFLFLPTIANAVFSPSHTTLSASTHPPPPPCSCFVPTAGFMIWFIIGILAMTFLCLTVVFHKKIFSPIPVSTVSWLPGSQPPAACRRWTGVHVTANLEALRPACHASPARLYLSDTVLHVPHACSAVGLHPDQIGGASRACGGPRPPGGGWQRRRRGAAGELSTLWPGLRHGGMAFACYWVSLQTKHPPQRTQNFAPFLLSTHPRLACRTRRKLWRHPPCFTSWGRTTCCSAQASSRETWSLKTELPHTAAAAAAATAGGPIRLLPPWHAAAA